MLRVVDRLVGMDAQALSKIGSIGTERADLMLPGCAIFAAICSLWPAPMLRVADRGLREGMLRQLVSGIIMKSGSGDASGRGRVPVKVKKDRGRTQSSRAWLQRQLNDPYVAAAKSQGLSQPRRFQAGRARPEIPFSQKGRARAGSGRGARRLEPGRGRQGRHRGGRRCAEIEAIPGVTFFQADLTDPDVPAMLKEALNGPADLVLTDMAAPTTGHRATDHIRTIALVEIALEVAEDVLRPGGAFVGQGVPGRFIERIAGAAEEILPRRETRQAARQPRRSRWSFMLCVGRSEVGAEFGGVNAPSARCAAAKSPGA